MAASVNPDFSGLLVADRFRLTRQIGRGGMGTVWIAVQEPLGREVALKLIRPELVNETRVRERFRREAKLVAQLNNPHIVSVIDFGETEAPGGGTTLYIAMELLRGRTLRDRLREGPMSPRETAQVIREIADALVSAHAAGVVHRDLKPDNVMLAENAPRPATVKLVDFGVAKSLTPEAGAKRLTQTGVMVGTPGYLAPEVVLGDEAGPSSDLYSLGVMWFEMLARRQPFAAQTPLALAMMHLSEPAPRLRSLVPGIPSEIAELVDELLRKDPAERPQDAAALVARVDGLLAAGLDETASPTISTSEPVTVFDQTRLQVFPTTANVAAATPQPATQPSVRTATLLPLERDTRPDPPTQPATVPLSTAAPRARILLYASAGAVLALGIAAVALLATSMPSVEPLSPRGGSLDAGTAFSPVDAGPAALPSGPAALPLDPGATRPPAKKPPLDRKSPVEKRPPPPAAEAKPPEKRPPPERRPPADLPHEPRIDLDPG